MLSYGNSSNPNPTLQSIQFADGTIQRSASTLQDLHIKKKLRTDDDSIFYKNVTIQGKLTVVGDIDFQSSTLPDTSQQYVNEQLATLHTLLGWNPVDQKWIYSNTSNSPTTNLDYRLHQFFTDYYRKTEIDTLLFDLHGTEYYTGSSGDQYEDPNTGLAYGGKMTAIPTGVSFIIPPKVGSMETIFVIQNSSYGAGKLLTSNADGVATWQDPAEIITPNVQHISTTDGQTNIPAFDIVDSSQPTHYLQFLPNASNLSSLGAYLSKDVHEIGDAVIRATSNLTITSGTGSGIVRPAGIRMTTTSQGELTIFGGWIPGTTDNTQMYDSGYTGTYSGTNIQLSDGNINMVHDYNRAIYLYGNVIVQQKETGEPYYNLNTHTIPALLDIHGTTITNALKLQTTTTPVINYIWTCTNADGSGHWAAPSASSSISTFTDDVTFEGNLETLGSITSVGPIQGNSSVTIDGKLTINDDVEIQSSLSINSLANTTVGRSNTFTNNIPSTDSTIVIQNYFTTPENGTPISASRLESSTNYYFNVTLDLGSVTVPAYNTSPISFSRPLYLQHNWAPTGNTTTRHNFSYSIYSSKCYVLNQGVTLLDSTINSSAVRSKVRTVSIEYEANKSGFIGANEVANDPNLYRHLFSQRFELDRLEFTFLPVQNPLDQTYSLSINLQIKYLGTGPHLSGYIWLQNLGTAGNYPPFIVSMGGPVWTLGLNSSNVLARITSHQNNLTTWLSWQYDPTNNTVSDVFSYSRYKNIVWNKMNQPQYFYRFTVNSSNQPVETFNIPPPITNELYNYKLTSGNFISNFLNNATDKRLSLGSLDVNSLNVNKSLNVYNTVNCFGIGTRRGKPLTSPDHLNIKGWEMWYAESDNACNFYWTGTNLETWIDSVLVTSVTANVSDHRLKHNLTNLSNDYMERLASLPLFSYSLQLDMPNSSITDHHIGFLAHQLQQMFPEHPHLVSGEQDEIDENGKPVYQLINYNELTVVLLKACQELQKENIKKARKLKKMEDNLLAVSYSINLAFIPTSLILIFIVITLVSPKLLESLHLEALFRFWF